MFCHNCQNQIDDSFRYCPYCGAELEVNQEELAKKKATANLIMTNRANEVSGPYEHSELSESGDYTITTRRVNLADIEELFFPDSVTKIMDHAFAGAKNLKTVVIPQGVTHIGAGAFMDCPRLATVHLAPSVVFIGADAFANCPSLHKLVLPPNATIGWKGMSGIETIDVSASTIYKQVGANLILTRDGSKLVHVHRICGPWQEHLGRPGRVCTVSKLELPQGVTVIGSYAFDGCYEYDYLRDELYIKSLPELILPEGIRELEAYAFYNSGYRSIVLPSTLEKVGPYAFKDCIHLERIANIANVDQVGKNICQGCNRLDDPETLAGISKRDGKG